MALSIKSKTNSSPLKNAKKVKPSTINHTTTVKPRKKKSYRYFDEYRDFFTKRKIPVSEAFLDKLADDLIDWANNDDKALTAEKFWYIKGISPRVAVNWRDRHPKLKNAYLDAKHRIGIRREEGSLMKKLDNSTFFRTAANYSQDFKDTAKFQSELKQKEEEKTQRNNITWIMDKFPDSKLVPKKDKEEK